MYLLFLVGSGTQMFQTVHTNKIANGFGPRPQRWKLSALSTAPPLLPRPVEHLPPWSDLRIGPHLTKLLLYPLKFSLSQRIQQRNAPFVIFIFTTFTLVHHHFFSFLFTTTCRGEGGGVALMESLQHMWTTCCCQCSPHPLWLPIQKESLF